MTPTWIDHTTTYFHTRTFDHLGKSLASLPKSLSVCLWTTWLCVRLQLQSLEGFCNIFDWFVDNKRSIHFGEDKTKLVLFGSKFKRKNIKTFHLKYGHIQIIERSKVKYLGCILDETMSGEAMALNIANRINNELKVFYCKNKFLIPALRHLLCNALMQPHFD